MYLTLNFCHTNDPDGAEWLQLMRDAQERNVPIVINGRELKVINVESGAILVQRAPATDITSVLLRLRGPENEAAENVPLPPELREYAGPED